MMFFLQVFGMILGLGKRASGKEDQRLLEHRVDLQGILFNSELKNYCKSTQVQTAVRILPFMNLSLESICVASPGIHVHHSYFLLFKFASILTYSARPLLIYYMCYTVHFSQT